MWALLDESDGTKRFFKCWSSKGLETTDSVDDAHRFNSEEEARNSVAGRYSLSFFEPVELVLAVKSKAAA